MELNKSVKRPILHYLGGKWLLAKDVVKYFPPHRAYVEPFGGAANILLRKPISELEVWNDLDQNLLNLFMVIRERFDDFKKACENTLYSESEMFYAYNTMFEGDEVERARKYAFHSIAAFGSQSKLAKRGFRIARFTDANARIKDMPGQWKRYVENLESVRDRLKNVLILSRDAFSIFDKFDTSETLWYIDPPYVLSSRKTPQNAAYNFELSNDMHIKLMERIKRLKGYVVLSGYDNDIYKKYLENWKVEHVKARNMAVCEATETLWINRQAA